MLTRISITLILLLNLTANELNAASSYIELNSAEGQQLVSGLSPLDNHSALSRFRFKDHCKVNENSYPKGEAGVYLVHFDLERDRDLFLSPRFSEDINDDNLDVTNILADKAPDTLLLRSIASLTQAAGRMTAEKLKPVVARRAQKITARDIEHYGLPMKYICSRLYFDEPAKGFMVLKREASGRLHLRGITWYCTFTTWSKGFKWKLAFNRTHKKFLKILTREYDPGDDSTRFPQLAELSILCSSGGCGGALLDLVKLAVYRNRTYKGLITDAKETIASFYAASGLSPVFATALVNIASESAAAGKETEEEELVRQLYYHWLSSKTSIRGLDPAHLYLITCGELYASDFLDRLGIGRPKVTFVFNPPSSGEEVSPEKKMKK